MTKVLRKYVEMVQLIVKTWENKQSYYFPMEDYARLSQEMKSESHIEVAPYTLVNKYNVEIFPIKVAQGSMESEMMKQPIDIQQELKALLKDRDSRKCITRWFKHLRAIYSK